VSGVVMGPEGAIVTTFGWVLKFQGDLRMNEWRGDMYKKSRGRYMSNKVALWGA